MNTTQSQTPRPELLTPKTDCIPSELCEIAQWVNWRADWQPEKGKYNKPPIDPKSLKLASSVDSATWSSFEVACQSYAKNKKRLAGIGFVLTKNDSFVGIDIDHCVDEDGRIQPEAEDIIRLFNSYTERSPSGTGIRIFVIGKLSGGGKNNGKVEIYDCGRYLTLTGHTVRDEPIQARQPEIDSLYEQLSGTTKKVAHVLPFVPSADNFDMRNFARGIEGYWESSGFGRAKCPAHKGEGYSSFHVNLSTGAYGCFKNCTPEEIRAAIGQPKRAPIFEDSTIEEPVNADDYARILFGQQVESQPVETLTAEHIALGCMTISYLLTELGMPPELRALADALLGASNGSSDWFEYPDIKLARHMWSDSLAENKSARRRLSRWRKQWVKWSKENFTIAEYIQGDRIDKTVCRPTKYRIMIWPMAEAILADAALESDFVSHPDRATQRIAEKVVKVKRLELLSEPQRKRRPQYRPGFDSFVKSIETLTRKAVESKKDHQEAAIEVSRRVLAVTSQWVTPDQILAEFQTLESLQVVASVEASVGDSRVTHYAKNGHKVDTKNGYVLRDKKGTQNGTYPALDLDDASSWEASDEANT